MKNKNERTKILADYRQKCLYSYFFARVVNINDDIYGLLYGYTFQGDVYVSALLMADDYLQDKILYKCRLNDNGTIIIDVVKYLCECCRTFTKVLEMPNFMAVVSTTYNLRTIADDRFDLINDKNEYLTLKNLKK